mmetsp:Transcript_24234/g.40600  ORF Transcript_24234/g.40600 Transcript_24234/m.40600 type:complete len:217 (-) Transcript_24234:6-656(-)
MSVHGQKAPPTTKVCTPECATSMRLFIHGKVARGSGSKVGFTSTYFASAAAASSFKVLSASCTRARSSSSSSVSLSLGMSSYFFSARYTFFFSTLYATHASVSRMRVGIISKRSSLVGPLGSAGSSGAASSSSPSAFGSASPSKTLGLSGNHTLATTFDNCTPGTPGISTFLTTGISGSGGSGMSSMITSTLGGAFGGIFMNPETRAMEGDRERPI